MAKTNSEESRAINLLGKRTIIKGDIVSEGDFRIDGELTGSLKSNGRVVVGTTGKVNGEITCKNIDIAGFIKGKLSIEEQLTLKASSEVQGEVITGK